MTRLFQAVPRERVLVLVLDDLREDPRREYLKALTFLGVADDGREYFPILNRAKANRLPTRQRALRPVIEAFLFLKRKTHLWGNSYLNVYLHQLYYGLYHRLATRPRPRPPLWEDLRRKLEEYFHDDVVLLSQVLGRDFTPWLGR